MKKGFTLIEIMAVITVLALITVAIVPSIIKQVTDKKDEVNGTTLELIYDAASLYTESDKATYKNEMGNVYCITLETLVKEGLLDKTVTNFKTGKAIPLNRFIKMSVNLYREFEYSLLEQDEKCIESSGTLLSEVAEVGDYVAYDAGVWSETKEKPTSQGEFGGYTKGENKASSVSSCYSSYTTSLKGWRILSISNNSVTIVHAGQSECYYHGTNSSTSITKLNNRATSEYLNDIYAESAHMMTKAEIDVLSSSNNLRNIGAFYWLATESSSNGMWPVNDEGNINNHSNHSYGVRPVIVLKEGIKTSGKSVDIFNQEAWQLIEA